MKLLLIIFSVVCHSALAGIKSKGPLAKQLIIVDQGPTANSDDKAEHHLDLFGKLKKRSAVKQTVTPALRAKLNICDRCHDAPLHSENSYLPILQGQQVEYLFAKVLSFKANKRSFHPLRPETQALNVEEIMDISLYYANQSSSLQKSLILARFDSQQSVKGEEVSVLKGCFDCHGSSGNGNHRIPAISGQNENYLGYRIREIASNSSQIHLRSVANVSCNVPDVDLLQSKQLARQLAMVLENDRVLRGEEIYRQNCSRCHEQGNKGAPLLSDKKQWAQRIRQGTRELVKNTVMGKLNMPMWGGNTRLSRNQIKDAIHFMIYQASLSDK